MVATIHYRWDFIGLSTQEKPTPETSDKVVDGSTFYSSDDSKLYVWYKDQWYERKALSGEGGGSTINVVQTTGESTTDVMSQKAVTDALGSVGGGSAIELTEADFNYPSANPTAVALWLLAPGIYYTRTLNVSNDSSTSQILSTSTEQLGNQSNMLSFIVANVNGSGGVFKRIFGFLKDSFASLTFENTIVVDSQGNFQNGSKTGLLSTKNVVDNLTATSNLWPLSANQGKVLNDKITALEARVAALEGN